ncbi:MAG: MtnX-like HAD-IB family phosphatase [Ignavibacteriales bacterium]|nr:MtnX-like HAD-IB family phosphatase [Ignavibacteriales bacterium]
MNKRTIKIFVDFDGTITLEDVGEAIFQKFGEAKKVNQIIEDLLTDKISSRQCWDDLCDSTNVVSKTDLDAFIDLIDIDPTYNSFAKFCSENEIEMIVLSDGFDYYIDRLLNKAGLAGLKYYSNKLFVDEKGNLSAKYPYFDDGSPTSANCKRNHIINHSSDDDFTIYIGDGNSDKDAAQYCDFIFAKNGLAKFCSIEKISFYPFNDFNDVKNKLTELMNKKNLRKRHQAQLKRKSAYMAE